VKYRTFGKLDWRPSALGFGAMRLPVLDNDHGKIDESEATRMIRHAIDHGVNYVDTAYPYHNGTSEAFLGRALQDGYRQRIKLATKLPCWKVKAVEDLDRLMDEQLSNLQTDQIDFYLLHSLDGDSWPKMRDLNVFAWAESALASGRIGHLGFSFHDKYELFQEIVDASQLWTFCQIQYNYLDIEYQAGTRGLQYASSKGLAVVIMEPLRGGALARNTPPAVQALWDSVRGPSRRHPRTSADWALQWLWNQPEVSLVLSGMNTMEQVEQNLESADRSGVGTMTEEQLALMAQARDVYLSLMAVRCTGCQYCLPCPQGVAIPDVLGAYNEAMMFADLDRASMFYGWIDEKARGNACIECGECLDKCPQGIEIPEWLKKAHEVLCQKHEV
jgi:predicted aldo/keto reductase-like oxidoreductase